MLNTKQKVKVLNFICSFILLSFFISCTDQNDEVTDDKSSNAIMLSELTRGKGGVVISGDEEFTINGIMVGSPLKATFNGKSSEVFRIAMSKEGKSLALNFYIPVSLGRTGPPNGTFPVVSQSAALDETYVEMFVVGDDAYNSFSNTTGTVTVSNTKSEAFPYIFDVEFDVQNLKSSDDLVINAQGAMKWGL